MCQINKLINQSIIFKNKFKIEDDVLFGNDMQAYSEKEIPSSPNRSWTYDLLEHFRSAPANFQSASKGVNERFWVSMA